ncbi:endolytic transglycosylase MltG [Mucilaginibacter sp. HMF5004]|uniref:endolytic transglycosylase MltG n=1 Tax=Mucilaginibacter rivuli TaxID=2857527 RepID=UPI001C5F6B08|nr:endolytic transglycosylase MltG [Mucilaginibacter rivuli]MBW4891864.1 endolytic transglycosylase MltG [Mucilaginibacter rivuli]
MATKKQASKSGFGRKFIIALVLIVILALGATGLFYYSRYYGANVTDKQEYLYIHTGATFDDVYKTIRDEEIVRDSATFKWAARNKNYINRVKPGRYRLKEGMSNRDLINMLITGRQEAVKLSIKNFRLKENFAAFVGKKMEADSASIMALLDSAEYVKKLGFTTEDVYTMILPDTYNIYWNSSPKKILGKLFGEYQKFWTPERRQKATDMGLNPVKVTILASVVDAEALYDSEMPTIAGLYLNRMKKGMKLEADPTVIFALHDFTIHRVLNKQLATNSPYNTYMHTGLPPGPIMMPSINAIKAVLDYKHSDYIYMCAKDDLSGYTNFASTVAQHLINARKFQQALNQRNIKH